MNRQRVSKRQLSEIDRIVEHYKNNLEFIDRFLDQVILSFTKSKKLSSIAHSMKWRLKEPDHLRDKLIRKAQKARIDNVDFDICKENLFQKVNDLVGFRILYLYTTQFKQIDNIIREIISEDGYQLFEGPKARSWDDETREYFLSQGIEVSDSPSSNFYTSVHYVISANKKFQPTCEIQVRTLAEEIWGEVDHSINYPYQVESTHCQEQIKVLARITSGCTRLVDSIFNSYEDYINTRSGA